jgi:hypothetical protein
MAFTGKGPARRTTMHPELLRFVRQWLGTVALALLPVVLTSFISLPMALHRHPGEAVALNAQHMT